MKFQTREWWEGIHRSKEIAGRGLVNSLEDHLEKAKELLKGDADSNQNKKLKIPEFHLPIRRKRKGKWRVIYFICAEIKEVEKIPEGFLRLISKYCDEPNTVVIMYVLLRNEKTYKKNLKKLINSL